MAAGPLALSSGERGSEWAARRLLGVSRDEAGEGGTCSVPELLNRTRGCLFTLATPAFSDQWPNPGMAINQPG